MKKLAVIMLLLNLTINNSYAIETNEMLNTKNNALLKLKEYYGNKLVDTKDEVLFKDFGNLMFYRNEIIDTLGEEVKDISNYKYIYRLDRQISNKLYNKKDSSIYNINFYVNLNDDLDHLMANDKLLDSLNTLKMYISKFIIHTDNSIINSTNDSIINSTNDIISYDKNKIDTITRTVMLYIKSCIVTYNDLKLDPNFFGNHYKEFRLTSENIQYENIRPIDGANLSDDSKKIRDLMRDSNFRPDSTQISDSMIPLRGPTNLDKLVYVTSTNNSIYETNLSNYKVDNLYMFNEYYLNYEDMEFKLLNLDQLKSDDSLNNAHIIDELTKDHSLNDAYLLSKLEDGEMHDSSVFNLDDYASKHFKQIIPKSIFQETKVSPEDIDIYGNLIQPEKPNDNQQILQTVIDASHYAITSQIENQEGINLHLELYQPKDTSGKIIENNDEKDYTKRE